MDGHQVTLATVTVESQTTSHNTKNNNIIIKKDPRFYFPISLWEHLQSNLEGGGKKNVLTVFFPHFFTSLAIYFTVIAIKAKKRKGCFYICAPYWHNKCCWPDMV